MLSCHTTHQYFKDNAIVFPSESAVDAIVIGQILCLVADLRGRWRHDQGMK